MSTVYYILFAITMTYWLYFVVTSLYAFKKDRVIKNHKPQTKFAIIIAGRNEELVIGDLIDSLKNQNYPKDLYEIYVMPNNCTDNTRAVAEKAGATIISSRKKISTKADALRICFKKLEKRKDIDAYLIFDADNVVHPDFLKAMNNSYCNGYEASQCLRDCKNISDNWLTGSYTLYYFTQNFFYNRARMYINGSASINGTGFMVSRELINRIGFNTKTLTEDIEFTAICALNDVKIDFVEQAITYDEHPSSFKASWKQRKRWTSGNLDCFKRYSKDLFKKFIKDKSIPALDMLLRFPAPFMQVLTFLGSCMLFAFRIFDVELNDIFSYLLNNPILFWIICYSSTVIISIALVKYNRKKIKDILSGIIFFSLFLLTWLPINIICIFKKTDTWEIIPHTKKTNIKELIN